MRFTRSHSVAMLAVLVGAASSLSLRPSAGDTSGPSVWFRVVEPDGSPVVRPLVVVSVFGTTYPLVRTYTGGVLGEVVVPVPADDPVAAGHLAKGEAVNLMIRVFDKPPGSSGINAAYVTAAVGPDYGGVVRELSEVNGKTFALKPGLTDFAPADAQTSSALDARGGLHDIAGTGVGVPDGPPPPPDDPEVPICRESPNDHPYFCYVADIPSWSQHVPVPIAENHGAGTDMVSSMRYHSSVVTQVSVALQVGVGGYFEAGGHVAYEEATSEAFGFRDIGPNDNVRAYLDSALKRERSGMCYKVNGVWQCQSEASYRPYVANGSLAEDSPMYEDIMDVSQDCWAPVYDDYEPESKSENVSGFAMRLGPSETFADQGQLYANSTITQQSGSKTGFVRKWTNAGSTYQFHYVYVPGGQHLYANDQTGFDLANCVRNNLDKVLTQATNTDYEALAVQGAPPPPRPPVSPDDGTAAHTACGNMPDRCD